MIRRGSFGSAWRDKHLASPLECVTIGLLKDGFDERLQWDDGFSESEKASIVARLKRRKLMLEEKAQEEREAAKAAKKAAAAAAKAARPKAVKVVAAASTQELTGLFAFITADLLC